MKRLSLKHELENKSLKRKNSKLEEDNKKLKADNDRLSTYNKTVERFKAISNPLICLNEQIESTSTNFDDLSDLDLGLFENPMLENKTLLVPDILLPKQYLDDAQNSYKSK